MGTVVRRLLEWLPVAAVVVAAVLVAGWGQRTDTLEEPAPIPRQQPFAGATSLSSAEAQSLVHNVRLEPRDLSGDFAPVVAHTQAALDEQPGSELCGASYPSEVRVEEMRTATTTRLQLVWREAPEAPPALFEQAGLEKPSGLAF